MTEKKSNAAQHGANSAEDDAAVRLGAALFAEELRDKLEVATDAVDRSGAYSSLVVLAFVASLGDWMQQAYSSQTAVRFLRMVADGIENGADDDEHEEQRPPPLAS
jgi:hypothetical protein